MQDDVQLEVVSMVQELGPTTLVSAQVVVPLEMKDHTRADGARADDETEPGLARQAHS